MIARDYRVSCPTFTDIRAKLFIAGCSPFLAAARWNEFRGPWNRFGGIPAALRSVRGNDKEQEKSAGPDY